MRIDDRLLGLILVVFGIGVFWVARGFPLMAGMPYGPGFFPSIAAVGLIVCGIVIAAGAAIRLRAAGPADQGTVERPGLAAAFRGGFLRPAIICGIVVAFALLLPHLGFHITATLAVGAAAFVFGAHPVMAPVLAVAAAFGAHAIFYSLLRVPLPWGVMTPYAW